ncbi:MAG: ROK family protein [Dermatophilaceae bacterium]
MAPQSERSARRERSRHQLLNLIRERGSITRNDLGHLTGLSRSAVAEGVQGLIRDNLVVEEGTETIGSSSVRGRPAALLAPCRPAGLVAGIDFGHAHVSVAVAGTDGSVLVEHRESVNVDDEAATALDTAAVLLQRCLTEANASASEVLSIAAGIPGPLDSGSHRVRSATILSAWVGLDPEQELSNRLGRTVHVGNDADMGAQGELRFGSARGCRDFLYIKASHGIGAGLVLNGETYRGSIGIAGEIGHTQLPGAGSWCRCGNRGCLETVVSITEIQRQLEHIKVQNASPDKGLSLASITNDPVAARVVTEAGRTLGQVLAELCNCLNPAAIILGGELGTAGGPLVAGVRESIDRYAQPAIAQAVDVRTAELGLRSELMGAVSRAMDHAQR